MKNVYIFPPQHSPSARAPNSNHYDLLSSQLAADRPHVPPGHDADREFARAEQALRRHLPAGLWAVADGVAVRL